MAENDPKWVDIQKKTFTRWANTFLKERLMKIDNLAEDLSDGVNLINLLEIISSKELGKYNTKPKLRAHKLENTGLALKFLTGEKIKLVNIGNEDIVDGKVKLILGLIWTIILRYQIHIEEGKSARSDLLKWVRQQIPEYDIQNFTKDWNDGRAICALANSLKPGLCNGHRELNPYNALANAELGMDLAWKDLEIPKVLDPRDMVDPEVDELSVMTYISYYRDWLANQGAKRKQEEIERTPVPARCRAYGPGVERGETNIQTYFTIEAINANGRRVPIGGHPFMVNIKSPSSTVPTNMTDNNDGTYTVKYTPTEVGKHIVSITLWDKHISNSPREVPVTRGGADAKFCKVFGQGVESGFVFEPALFTIQAYNRLGEQVRDGGDPFEVKVAGPYNMNIPAKVVDNKNGTYSCSYEPIDPGTHVVNVTLTGQHVDKSPYRVPIAKSNNPKIADALQCIAYGPGLEGGYAHEPAIFTIEARNSRGDKIAGGGAPIDADVCDSKGVEVPVKLVDNRDGTFTATYEPRDAGIHTVDVILRHYRLPLYYDHIKDSPFKVKIEAGADANNSIAFGPGLEDGIPDTLPTHFTIQAKDHLGNNMKKGGDPFEVKIQGPKGLVDAKVTDNDDGTYTVVYEPKDAGKHKIDVNLKGKPIKNAPYTVMVKEGADNANSFIEKFTFTIRARSKRGENLKYGGDDFKVNIDGPSGAVPNVALDDIGDGTYLCSYKLPGPGNYTVNVNLNGKPIKGSPWRQNM